MRRSTKCEDYRHKSTIDSLILPFVCPKCLKIISFITEADIIYKILDHLGLRSDKPSRDPPEDVISHVVYEPFDDGWIGYEEPCVVLN